MLDDVLLLSPGGRVVFLGPGEDIANYFANLNFACPPFHNPVSRPRSQPHRGRESFKASKLQSGEGEFMRGGGEFMRGGGEFIREGGEFMREGGGFMREGGEFMRRGGEFLQVCFGRACCAVSCPARALGMAECVNKERKKERKKDVT